MDGYLLDTSFLTTLLDPNHPKHAEARRAEAALDVGAVQYVSIVALAELIFGCRTAVKFGHGPLVAFEEKINKAKAYPLLEPTKHTAEEYGELKAILAKTYLKSALRKDRPRWIEEWVDSATGQKLQVDENDLWMCAQTRERNLVLITTDRKMVRISQADPTVQLLII